MGLYMENGKYVPTAEGTLKTVSGAEELKARIIMRLTARRGAFSPMPEYGSRLHTLMRSVPKRERESAARAFVAEALREESAVRVDRVTYSEAEGGAVIELRLSAAGEDIALEVRA